MRYSLGEADGVRQDLADHYEYIVDEGQPAVGLRLIDAYDEMTVRLCEWPRSGRRFEADDARLTGVRVVQLASSYRSYLVYYVVRRRAVRVLAVLHASTGERRRIATLRRRHDAEFDPSTEPS